MNAELVEASVIEEAAAPPEPTVVQLRLLPAFSPLTTRFGAEFFRGLPQRPGVYLMRDERDRLIYVGKAKNLRQRLNSYRHPAHASRKTVRLVHAIRRIEWELCDSDEAAQLRENALIRAHRPRFNRLGTWPKMNCFILMQANESKIRFELTREAVSEPAKRRDRERKTGAPFPELLSLAANTAPGCVFDEPPERARPWAQKCNSANDGSTAQLFGAFKPGAAWALAALLRLLWQTLHQINERTALPRRLLLDKPPATFDIDHHTVPVWTEPVTRYFSGDSPALVDALSASLPAAMTTFEEQARQTDLERLQHFFLVGPRLNREFNHRRATPGLPISQEELDDLMVLRRRVEAAVTDPEP